MNRGGESAAPGNENAIRTVLGSRSVGTIEKAGAGRAASGKKRRGLVEFCHLAAARRLKLWSLNANLFFKVPHQLTKLT